ncbi:LOW QUALITY PROTEIN: transcriptional regulator, TetR family [Vibrio sp. JCM 18904]|nr:LOW QUALITY PROTEIN: transcriptional regulator, TetR family [Vibrio sp. JCM 18904]
MKEKIAVSLEKAFSQYASPSRASPQLKNACEVSLRTCTNTTPPRKRMIVAALEHRHQRYLSFLLEDAPPANGTPAVLHLFTRLEDWMKEFAPNGCMSINALAAIPENLSINQAVKQHKLAVRQLMVQLSQREDLATTLFLLHEGLSNAWPVLGHAAFASAEHTLLELMKENNQ